MGKGRTKETGGLIMIEKVKCPYCGYEFEPESHYENDDESNIEECPNCEHSFVCWQETNISFSAEKADCLNGGKHDWKPIPTYPKCATLMRCTKCHQERKPTDEEMIKYHIPTYKEYFDERKRKEIEEDKKSWEKAI